MKSIELCGYNIETVIAEKIETILQEVYLQPDRGIIMMYIFWEQHSLTINKR